MDLAVIISYLQKANYFQLRPKMREIEDADGTFFFSIDTFFLWHAPLDKTAYVWLLG